MNPTEVALRPCKVTTAKVIGCLRKALDANGGENVNVHTLDGEYRVACGPGTVLAVRHTHTNGFEHVSDGSAWDDFPIALKGLLSMQFGLNSVGVLAEFSRKPKCNVVVVNVASNGDEPALEVRWIETQRDSTIDILMRPRHALSAGVIFI